MNGGCKSVGIVDPVHDVEITVLVETARFDKAKFPLALAFGNDNEVPSLSVIPCSDGMCDSLSLSGSMGS